MLKILIAVCLGRANSIYFGWNRG